GETALDCLCGSGARDFCLGFLVKEASEIGIEIRRQNGTTAEFPLRPICIKFRPFIFRFFPSYIQAPPQRAFIAARYGIHSPPAQKCRWRMSCARRGMRDLLAAPMRPSFAERTPRDEGVARRKAQTYGSAILADSGGRLSARHMRSYLVRYRASRYLSA